MVRLNIKALLKMKNKSKYDLVRALGSNYTVINNMIENNTESIHFKTLDKLVDFFDCSFDDLFIKDNKKNKE